MTTFSVFRVPILTDPSVERNAPNRLYASFINAGRFFESASIPSITSNNIMSNSRVCSPFVNIPRARMRSAPATRASRFTSIGIVPYRLANSTRVLGQSAGRSDLGTDRQTM